MQTGRHFSSEARRSSHAGGHQRPATRAFFRPSSFSTTCSRSATSASGATRAAGGPSLRLPRRSTISSPRRRASTRSTPLASSGTASEVRREHAARDGWRPDAQGVFIDTRTRSVGGPEIGVRSIPVAIQQLVRVREQFGPTRVLQLHGIEVTPTKPNKPGITSDRRAGQPSDATLTRKMIDVARKGGAPSYAETQTDESRAITR